MERNDLFEVRELSKLFPVYGGMFQKKVGDVKAVDNVSFNIKREEIFGLVGESGCGKSTVGRLLLRLIEPSSGVIKFDGKNTLGFTKLQLKEFRKEVQMVFQDPFSSLNPRMTVGKIIADPILALGHHAEGNIKQRVKEMMEIVAIDPRLSKKHPHEFSGGHRQRLSIATALSINPQFIFFDEPVSALDLSAQAQILNLIRSIRDEFGITALVVAHDLSVIEFLGDRVAVMYLGSIVELCTTRDLYKLPRHPYTIALMSAIPSIDPHEARSREEIVLKGEIPSPLNAPSGCKFHTRCQSFIGDICVQKVPELIDVGDSHYVACHLFS
jgi:oligopeptide/dipeptide ABC transporter ATP-binding protein